MTTQRQEAEPPTGTNCPAVPVTTTITARTTGQGGRPRLTRREWLRTAALTPLAAATITPPMVSGASAAETLAVHHPASLSDFPANAVRLYMKEDRGCGETMLLAGCQALGFPADQAADMGLGLSGGIGLQGKTCACVIAGAQLLSLVATRSETDPAARKKGVYGIVGHFVKQFAAEFGATDCRVLCGLDLTKPEELKRFKVSVKGAVCSKIVEKTARLLAETIPSRS